MISRTTKENIPFREVNEVILSMLTNLTLYINTKVETCLIILLSLNRANRESCSLVVRIWQADIYPQPFY